MEDFELGTPEYDRELFRTFSAGQAALIKLIASHAAIGEVIRGVCDLVEDSMIGARAIVVSFRSDHTADLTSREPVEPKLAAVITEHVSAGAAITRTGKRSERFEVTDPTNPDTHVIWGRVVPGLGDNALGALCVTRDWPADVAGRTKGAFYSASRLLQIALEQHRAARNFADTIATERERIANELHDDPIQEITVLSLMLQRIARNLPPDQWAQVDEARQKADRAIDQMRRMLFELHPATLELDGLGIATEIYLEETVEALDIDWTVDDQLVSEPDEASAVLIFRLIHEALANVAKHSKASNVSVVLRNEHDGIDVHIQDDGRGFDTSIIGSQRPGHLGIANIRYLAQRTGGRFDVTSAPGEGCSVDIWIPAEHGRTASTPGPD